MHIEASILNATVVRISKQIVHPIRIHLTVNKISPDNALLRFCAAFE
jgi:hypothetical protein